MTDGHAESSDEMLMVRYKRGDRAAFATLVKRHQRPLFNFSLRYLTNRESAKEVTQEAFLRVVKRSADFRHESRFSTWLFSIARNLCIDELRKRKHRNHMPLDGSDTTEITSKADNGQRSFDGEQLAADSELRWGIIRAVDALPEEQREVFLLRHLGGVPFSEIARITATPENTVKSRMRYALDRLKQQLSEYEEYARALR